MNHVVLSALLPVVALIALGFALGRAGWIGPQVLRILSNVSFFLLTPIVLFRAMCNVHVEQLDLRPAGAYIAALAIAFAGVLVWRGLNRTSAVLALAVTYSNAVMIGIPLIGLAWGEAGLVTLSTLIPIHSLLLLTIATVALEFSLAREHAALSPDVAARMLTVAGRALRKAFLHPVPLPILAGLLFAQTGLVIPPWADQMLRALGSVFGPLALLLVGIALAGSAIGASLRPALVLAGIKNFLVPALAAGIGWAFGMRGVPLAVLVATAALPIGANVFIFSQRYGVVPDLITAGVAVSTLLATVSVSLVLLLAGWGG